MMAHRRSRYRDAVFVPLSVLEFRDRAATFFGDKVGVIDGDAQFTYRAFGERTHRLANALVELGVEPGDRVSFITFNTHHLLEAYYGVIEAGAVLNPINIRLAPHEIAYILDHAGVEGRLLPPRLRAARRGDRAAARRRGRRFVVLDGEPGGRRRPRVRGPARRRARRTRATPTSTRTPWPSCSTRAARPACPRASR